MRNTVKLGAVAAFVTLALPVAATAQTCVGEPVGSGQSSIQFGIGFPAESTTGYRGAVRTNPGGPLSYEAGYTYTTFDGVDQKMHTIGGTAEYELPVSRVGVCAATGLSWSTISDDPTNSSVWEIPFGLAAGHEIAAGSNMFVTPHVMPMVLWQRASSEILGESFSASNTSFAFQGGLTFGTEAFFAAARAMKIFEDEVDTRFSIEGGFLF
jgi:hypothetical protein